MSTKPHRHCTLRYAFSDECKPNHRRDDQEITATVLLCVKHDEVPSYHNYGLPHEHFVFSGLLYTPEFLFEEVSCLGNSATFRIDPILLVLLRLEEMKL